MKGRATTQRRPISFNRNAGHLSQINIALNSHDAALFEELVETLDRNHLMHTSRSFCAKWAIAVALQLVRKAERDGTYADIARVAAKVMQQPEAPR